MQATRTYVFHSWQPGEGCWVREYTLFWCPNGKLQCKALAVHHACVQYDMLLLLHTALRMTIYYSCSSVLWYRAVLIVLSRVTTHVLLLKAGKIPLTRGQGFFKV